jgi:hypothetical protein
LVQAIPIGRQRQIVVDAISVSKLLSSCWTSPQALGSRVQERCHEPIEDEIQRSMIIITHDPAVIKMDTVLEMEGGRHL